MSSEDRSTNKRIVRQELSEIQHRQEETEQRAQQADAIAKRALERTSDTYERISELESEIDRLQAEVDELRDSQSLLRHVTTTRDLSVEERALVILQTLYHDTSNSQSGKAYMTVREAWTELRREIPRPRTYDVIERAEMLVGNRDLCTYKKEPRGSQPPSRLILDLSEGDLPPEIDGHSLHQRRGR